MFHPAPRLTALDLAEVLATVEPLLRRLLDRRGLGERDHDAGAPDAWVDETPVLTGLGAASVQGVVALGPRRGAHLRRLGHTPEEPDSSSESGGCQARANGFDLRAGVVVPAGQRARLERVCRDALRPPITSERLHLTEDGQVRLDLRPAVARRDDGGGVRPVGVPGAAGGAGAAAGHQPAAVPRRAGGPGDLAGGGGAARAQRSGR